MSGALRIAAGIVSFAEPADLRRIMLEAADENERLREALWSVVHNLDGRTEPVHHLMVQACVDKAKRALNHPAPAAQQEGE